MPDRTPASRPSPVATGGAAVLVLAGAAAVGSAAWLVVDTTRGTAVTWVLGRAAGLASYVLLVLLVASGLLLAHPWARGLRRPTASTRLALHSALATFTLAFTALHVVALAVDPWAQVGWRGAVLPMVSGYRPVAVTLGVLALWAGLITGITARFAGRLLGRAWWPIHKVAAVSLGLVWMHGVLAGSDVGALRGFYLASGLAVLGLAVTRYAAPTPADRVDELTDELARTSPPSLVPRRRVPR